MRDKTKERPLFGDNILFGGSEISLISDIQRERNKFLNGQFKTFLIRKRKLTYLQTRLIYLGQKEVNK